jgi:hypothetical protein
MLSSLVEVTVAVGTAENSKARCVNPKARLAETLRLGRTCTPQILLTTLVSCVNLCRSEIAFFVFIFFINIFLGFVFDFTSFAELLVLDMRSLFLVALIVCAILAYALGSTAEVSDTGDLKQLTSKQLVDMEKIIQDNKVLATASGYNIGLFDLAINRLAFYNELRLVNDEFFKAASTGVSSTGGGTASANCRSQPQESVSSYYIPIQINELSSFLGSEFVTNLPKNAVSKLELLKFMRKDTTLSDSFARMFVDETEVDRLEVGHVIIKAFYDPTTVHILILAPSLIHSLDKGCNYGSDFRNKFIGMAQDLQNWMAIKAAENKAFADALNDFNPNYGGLSVAQLASKGYKAIQQGGRVVYRRLISNDASHF